jgi:hypothetical protein
MRVDVKTEYYGNMNSMVKVKVKAKAMVKDVCLVLINNEPIWSACVSEVGS